MPQFDILSFSSQLFWLVLIFGGLYIIVSKFIAPKAEFIVNSRAKFIEDNIETSEQYNNQAIALEELKKIKLDELDLEAEELRSQAMAVLTKHFEDKKQNLAIILDKKLNNADKEFKNYVNSFHKSEEEPCVDLASFIIEKITNRKADLKLLKKLHQDNQAVN